MRPTEAKGEQIVRSLLRPLKGPCTYSESELADAAELADLHQIIPLLYLNLRDVKAAGGSRAYESIRSTYFHDMELTLKLWKEFLSISALLENEDIVCVPIKGLDMLARFYPYFESRCMVDADILIKEDDLPETESILLSHGFERELFGYKREYWIKHQCHLAFKRENIRTEVHWALDFKRGKSPCLPGLWQRLRVVEANGRNIRLLSPEDAVFAYALHLRRFGFICSLKQVYDIWFIIDKNPDFDWEYITRESKSANARMTMAFALIQASMFTDLKVPRQVLRTLNIGRRRARSIERFLKKETFRRYGSMKYMFLKAHFLLFDSFIESAGYICMIPYEQFCRFYGILPYSRVSYVLYWGRFFFMPLRAFSHAALMLLRRGN